MKYVNSPYNAACPVCSNSQNKLLYKVSAAEAANHFLVTHGIDKGQAGNIEHKIAQLWKNGAAAVVLCNNCSFVFANPFIAGDYGFYNLLPHSTGAGPENWKWEFDQTFKAIAGIASDKKDLNLLEIGASTGDFIKRIADIIPPKNILCL
jgi:hypothetical protein